MEKGEIWIVQLPYREGREQEGKRPAVIIADTKTDIILLMPLTSNLEALKKLPYTIEIKKSYKTHEKGCENEKKTCLKNRQNGRDLFKRNK